MSVKCPTPLHAALYAISLDGADLHTGDAEDFGNTWWIRVTEPEVVDTPDYGAVTVPTGNYVLSEDGYGHVYITQRDTWADAEADYRLMDAAYGEWLEAEETAA